MVNRELVRVFSQIADLLEIKGEDHFRINAYRSAARAIAELTEDITEIAARKGLLEIPGIGKGTAGKIEEYLRDGRVELHQELLAQYPPGLQQLLEVRGLGPRKVDLLYRELDVGSVADLRAAIAAGKVQKLKGFGEKTAKNILEGLDFLERAGERTPLGIAAPISASLAEVIGHIPGVGRVQVAGSLRRGRETVADLDLLCEAADGKTVIEQFTHLGCVKSVLAAGDTKASVMVDRFDGGEIQCDLRVVPTDSFGAALQYFTGSKEHSVRLREIAARRGWLLNEYGLFHGQRRLAGREEADIYGKLGFPLIPPELRENRGEIEAGGNVPDLITASDIRGDLHAHTTASDGRLTIDEMVLAARGMGYQYLAITDHSRSSVIAGGLTAKQVLQQAKEIRALNAELKGFTIFSGVECDILPDGSLDYPDEVLAQLDWVIASIHASQRLDRAAQTRRSIAAIENPYVCVLGHPSGRLLGRRDAMDLDWEAIFQAAARTGTALELNASWLRLDLSDLHVRKAMDAGCWLSINTDAHSATDLADMTYGVQTARRGWARKSRVLNTLTAAALRKWIATRRSAKCPPA